MAKVIERMELAEMPFDRNGVHATGYHCYFDDGTQYTEYEDDLFEDAPNCKYTYEEVE